VSASADQGEAPSELEILRRHGILRLRAGNPGPLSLSGTNTWIVGSDPAYVIDPGPALPEHLDALTDLLRRRGGLGGIALTHDHPDHCEAIEPLRKRMKAPLAAARAEHLRLPGDVRLSEGERFGPLTAVATPGHAPDHFSFLLDGVCFAGDAVLGEGSVFIAPDPGALAGYLAALERLIALPLQLLCPGHGPLVSAPKRKLQEYLDHRRERERRLVQAIDTGARQLPEMLDSAWSEVPKEMRQVALFTLAAHLEKLFEEGRLPPDMQRPTIHRSPGSSSPR
jgi:glyoxylase-like metal-dependent hydrolase (beta-lactamase superfamily II)